MRIYDKTFGDDKICACGHVYYRHFDTYDGMAPVGCKYCECHQFTAETGASTLAAKKKQGPLEHHAKCPAAQAWDIPAVPCECPRGWPRR